MLVDNIANWRRYGFGPAWNEVMTWLEAAPGRHDLMDGAHKVGDCTVNVASLQTRPWREARYETHRLLCDVHLVLSGREGFFNVATTDTLPDGDFDVAKDIGFHSLRPDATVMGEKGERHDTARLTLLPGTFVLVFPWDAHMPALAVDDKAEALRKCIAKIPLDALQLI